MGLRPPLSPAYPAASPWGRQLPTHLGPETQAGPAPFPPKWGEGGGAGEFKSHLLAVGQGEAGACVNTTPAFSSPVFANSFEVLPPRVLNEGEAGACANFAQTFSPPMFTQSFEHPSSRVLSDLTSLFFLAGDCTLGARCLNTGLVITPRTDALGLDTFPPFSTPALEGAAPGTGTCIFAHLPPGQAAYGGELASAAAAASLSSLLSLTPLPRGQASVDRPLAFFPPLSRPALEGAAPGPFTSNSPPPQCCLHCFASSLSPTASPPFPSLYTPSPPGARSWAQGLYSHPPMRELPSPLSPATGAARLVTPAQPPRRNLLVLRLALSHTCQSPGQSSGGRVMGLRPPLSAASPVAPSQGRQLPARRGSTPLF